VVIARGLLFLNICIEKIRSRRLEEREAVHGVDEKEKLCAVNDVDLHVSK
jgi:hypothetical protein